MIFVFIGTWSYLCISTKQWIAFQVGDAMAIGVMLGVKPAQKYLEGKNNKVGGQ
jgi:hypothetical protein